MKLKKQLLKIAMCTIALTISMAVIAQQKTITGRVLNPGGLPIPGVTVLVKNNKAATTTNERGDFSISVSNSDVLVFTSVGFGLQERYVGAVNTINITLYTVQTDLNDVVVVGYGSQRKKDITGSVVSIKTDYLPQTANPSINNLLQGRAAGLNLDQRSAQPGAKLNVNIRGATNPPLYVIDGVPIFNSTQAEPAIVSFGSAVETGFNGGGRQGSVKYDKSC